MGEGRIENAMRDRWGFGCFPDKVWIARRVDAPLPDGAKALPALEATWQLEAWLADGVHGRVLLAEIGEALGIPVSTGPSFDPRALGARLREALLDGRLHAYRMPYVASGARFAPPEPIERDAPAPAPREDKTWVGIQLMDDGDPPQPVPFKRYRIELPDRSVREGLLDQNGQAVIVGIDAGTCKISFPQLHADDWRPA
ncbi:hypothetical protein predicted by Glimmer/Critica [Sorangium cellulosum So ce56]|uniref:Uncharacterized protein n=1 Tax=Sorangium cellulosum (strain So ce56) TaxID=448385 RepID=A9GQ35_SORC5|nr:hypothetical protein [Sorangium cellulosum]CAN96841.1 hypothetical protein predicted by Glimmer/Critica [Sorangium cellulosum So ce56]